MRRTVSLLMIALVLAACASTVPPLGRAKQAVYALGVVYDRVQIAVAEAYRGKQITKAQWDEFVVLDTKIVASGRLFRDALRAWEAGAAPTQDRVNQLSTDLVGLVSQSFDLALKLGVKLPFTKEVLTQ